MSCKNKTPRGNCRKLYGDKCVGFETCTMHKIEQLLECPFCGGVGKLISHDTMDDLDEITVYYIMCQNCLATTNQYSEEEVAILNWNRRS